MILKKHIPLKAKYLAILGLVTLPAISIAHPKAEPVKQHVTVSQPKVGGVASFNYYYDDTGGNHVSNARKYGDWRFYDFKLHLTGDISALNYHVEYAWFRGMLNNLVSTNDPSTYNQFLETHVGYKFSNGVVGQVGNTKVPFGNPETLGFWHNINFWAGFGDNYQTGLKMMYKDSPWDFEVQLGKNSLVNPNSAESYAPKLTTGIYVPESPENAVIGGMNVASTYYAKNNEDSLQLAARVVHTHHFHENTKVAVGLSGRIGNTYNTLSTKRENQWAAALHANGYVDRWLIQLQYLPYRYSPKYPGADYGVGSNIVHNTMQLGKDGVLYTIPTKANIYAAGVGYKIPVSWGKIEEVTVFEEYSTLSGKDTKKNTKMNTIGFKINVGPLFLIAEAITAKNMVGIGQGLLPNGALNIFNIGGDGNASYVNNAGALATTYDDSTNHWKTKFNINIAAKF